MTKQIINVGTSANDRRGDSLRAAFQKVNANFTELYTTLGLDTTPLNLGAFEFTGSVLSTTDSSSITIDQATTVASNLTVGGDLLPSVANGGDLGSVARPWKSLYVSNNTIYIGNTAVGINQLGQLTVAGSSVSSVDRLTSSGDEVVLFGGANPYTSFPAITGGDQLSIQGAEVLSISGNLALTSQGDLNIISNGSGTAPGGSKNWTFGDNGNLTLPRGYIKNDTTDGFLKIEGPLFSDMVSLGGGGYATIANGVQILTHAVGDDTERKFNFSWDGSLYMPTASNNSQVGAIEWRLDGGQVAQVKSSPGGGNPSIPKGLQFLTYGGDTATTINAGFTNKWIFREDGSLTIPGDIRSEGNINIDINLTDSTLRRWSFGEDGDLNIPGAVRQGNSKLAFNENGGTNVYLTPTTDDSSAVFINPTSVQAYATEAVSIQAGNAAGLGDLELNWANAEVVWIDARDQDAQIIAPATRPWAGMSSYDAYPVILNYTDPGGVLPTPSDLPVVANSARQAHIAWQAGLETVEGVSITAGAYGWQFKPTGVLELTGAVQLKVYASTLERNLYIETPVAGMMVMVGTATQVYDGSAWRTLTYV